MTAITIRLADDRAQKLNELAAASGVSPEEFLRQSVEVWLEQSKTDWKSQLTLRPMARARIDLNDAFS